MSVLPELPIADVRLRPLKMNRDARGVGTEVFRAGWDCLSQPVQWTAIHSLANVLRGIHVHLRRLDYLVVLQGQALVGLRDLRIHSTTFRSACLAELDQDALSVLEIPPGVAHGFYFPIPTLLLCGFSEYWEAADDLACRWNDRALGIPWPHPIQPSQSPRDEAAGSLAELLASLEPHQARLNHWRKAA